MIVIHVGLKKAGSTSIQAFLSNNEEALRALSLDYPALGRRPQAPAHHNVAREIIEGLKKFDPQYGTVSQLADYWRTAPRNTLVLSSELLEEAEVHEIRLLHDTLSQARHNEQFRVLLIIRDLLDLMPSSYAQKVKFGVKTHDFDEFFEERMRARRVNYFQTAERWASVFGWNAMHLRLLACDHLVNGDLIDDLMTSCGVRNDADPLPPLQRPRASNAAPGWKVLEAARALFGGRHGLPVEHPLARVLKRKGKTAIGKLAIRIGQKWGWNDDRGQYLTRSQAQTCLEVFRSSIRAMNAHLPQPLPTPLDLDVRGFRPRGFLPDASQIRPDELRAFYEEIRVLDSSKRGSGSRKGKRSDRTFPVPGVA